MLTKPIEKLIISCEKQPETEEADHTTIHVDELVSRAAFIYEKVRNAVDYREDHLIRRAAIERILRRLLVRGAKSEVVARPLIIELIRARYLKNDSVPESRITTVETIIARYVELWNAAPAEAQRNMELFEWMLGVASREIEEAVAPSPHIDQIVEAMYRSVLPRLKLPAAVGDEREGNTQLFIAIHRGLARADQQTIRYKLLNIYEPRWRSLEPAEVRNVGWNIASIAKAIERDLNHAIGEKFSRAVRKEAVYFTILHDIIEENPSQARDIATDPASLEDHIRHACQQRYKWSKEKLGRAAMRSIVFIFMTKIVLALVLEIPYEIYLLKHFQWLPLLINITLPPFLLFLIATTTGVPGKKNTEKIIESIRDIVEDGRTPVPIEIGRLSKPLFSSFLLTLSYLALYGVTFGIIISGLRRLDFNIVSGGLFLLFLSIVSFFGIRIRQGVRRLEVLDRKENIISFLFDLFTIPIIRAGRWISIHSSRINIFVFILDFLIEAPFKSLLDIIEEFTTFIREKKEEIF